jgi:hypothetical protein
MMLSKRFEDIDGQDILGFIKDRVPESQYIEYKREPWGNSSAERKESLYDITAFANAYGGDIIVGMQTDGDIPVKVVPIADAAALQSDLQKRAIAGVDPRIPGLQVRPVATPDGDVLLVRVPRSGRSPHMVTLEATNKFYRRHGKDKLLMSVDEIGDAFLVTGQRVERGLDIIARHQQSACLEAGAPTLCMASLPLLHYPRPIEATETWVYEFLADPPSSPEMSGWTLLRIHPNVQVYYEIVPTLEGLVKRHTDRERPYRLALARNGLFSFRAGGITLPPEEREIVARRLIASVVHFLRASKTLAERLDFQGEIASSLTLANTQTLTLRRTAAIPGENWYLSEAAGTELTTIAIEPVTWDSASEPDSVALRLMNIVYNAFHYKSAPLFRDGKYDPTAIEPPA